MDLIKKALRTLSDASPITSVDDGDVQYVRRTHPVLLNDDRAGNSSTSSSSISRLPLRVQGLVNPDSSCRTSSCSTACYNLPCNPNAMEFTSRHATITVKDNPLRNSSNRLIQASAAPYAPPGNGSGSLKPYHDPAPFQLPPQQPQQTNNNNNNTHPNNNNNNNPHYQQQ